MSKTRPHEIVQMNDSQRRVYDAIKVGPRGKVGGPFPALLHCPEIADRIQGLGECLRFDGQLMATLREIAILTVAQHWRCIVEWNAHVSIAEELGISRTLIMATAGGGIPSEATSQETLVLTFCREMVENQKISDSTYHAAVDTIGLDGIVELVSILGYFTMLSMVLNTFEITPAADATAIPAELELEM